MSVCQSVRSSVTPWYCIKTKKKLASWILHCQRAQDYSFWKYTGSSGNSKGVTKRDGDLSRVSSFTSQFTYLCRPNLLLTVGPTSLVTKLVPYYVKCRQWLKYGGTRGNAVPTPPVFSPKRSPTSNFQRTQGNAKGNDKVRWHPHFSISCSDLCSHRRRDSTQQLRCVGVGGVYWA